MTRDSQRAHEKMLNITNCYRNANQYYNEVSSHPSKNGQHKKNPQTLDAGEGVGKRELCVVDVCICVKKNSDKKTTQSIFIKMRESSNRYFTKDIKRIKHI